MSEPDVEPPRFARAWRILLPLGLAVMAAAALAGVFDTTAKSAWAFVAGAVIGIVGVASLVTRGISAARDGARALERRIDDEIAGDGR